MNTPAIVSFTPLWCFCYFQVNVVVRYQVTNASRPLCHNIVQRPLLRAGSSSSSVTGSRSTGSSRLSRSSRSSPNSFRSNNGHLSKHAERRYTCNGPLYTALPVSDRVLQHEVHPSKQALAHHKKTRKETSRQTCSAREASRQSEAARKREMFDYTISIPTTIQEETSRSSRSLSPMLDKHRLSFVDRPVAHYEEMRQLPAKVVNSVLKRQSGRYRDANCKDPTSLDEIDVEIHVNSGNVPVIKYDEE